MRYVTATALLLLTLCATPAHAARPATVEEAAAIQRDLGLEGCGWQVAISTVDSSWAHIETDPEHCLAVITEHTSAHFDDITWTGAPWTSDIESLCPEHAAIAAAVAADLSLCVGHTPQPLALLPCDNRRTGNGVFLREPPVCHLHAPSDAYGTVANLRRLRWDDWGSPTATARGHEGQQPVTVRAWRLRRICDDFDGSRAYTRLRVSSLRGALAVRRATC